MSELTITPSGDAALVADLTRRAWHGTVDPRSSGHRLTVDDVVGLLAAGTVALVALDGSGAHARPLGSVLLEPDGTDLTLMKLAVPDERGRGVAGALIEAAVAEGRACGAGRLVLAVSQLQAGLARFYARRGFVVAPGARYRRAAPGSLPPIVMHRALRAGEPLDDPVGDAVAALGRGALVVLPTETVYGLGALASDPVAVRRVFATKGRPVDHPLIVHLAGADALDAWAVDIPGDARRLAAALWPGPLTLVLRRAPSVPLEVTGGLDTVAVRVPAHPVALAVLGLLPPGSGVAAPSANRFGRVSPTTAAAAQAELGGLLLEGDRILDGGPCAVGVESTILDLTADRPTVLRPGGCEVERIEAVLGRPVERVASGPARAPGMLAAHYAPMAGVVLTDADGLAGAVARAAAPVGVLAPPDAAAVAPGSAVRLEAPDPYDGAGLAPVLYARLREADARGLATLVVVVPEERGLGWAVADRLRRAATGSGGPGARTRSA